MENPVYTFPVHSPGKPKTRICERCGAEYTPRARTQKYCTPDCTGKPPCAIAGVWAAKTGQAEDVL